MIHFKTIQYKDFKSKYICFIYDEYLDVYYTSSDVYNVRVTCTHRFNSVLNIWYTVRKSNVSLIKFISEDIITQYYDFYPNAAEIIAAHNKIYKRIHKLNKML